MVDFLHGSRPPAQAMTMDTGEPGRRNMCVNAGKCAPYMASGKFQDFLNDLLRVAGVQLLEDLCDVEAQERDNVLRDFEKAKTYLILIVSSKTRFWQQLPYLLCGLANPNIEVAQNIAVKVLQQFEATLGASHHRVTLLYLAPGCRLRLAVEKLAAHGNRDDPYFKVYLCLLAMIPVSERPAEAPHAKLKQTLKLGTFQSPPTISLNQRLPEIIAIWESKPSSFKRFCELAHTIRRPLKIVARFQFGSHPAVANHIARRGTITHKLAGLVLYHCDLESMHLLFLSVAGGLMQHRRTLKFHALVGGHKLCVRANRNPLLLKFEDVIMICVTVSPRLAPLT